MNFIITPIQAKKLASFLGLLWERNLIPSPPNNYSSVHSRIGSSWIQRSVFNTSNLKSLNGAWAPLHTCTCHEEAPQKKIPPLLPIALVDNSKTLLTFYILESEVKSADSRVLLNLGMKSWNSAFNAQGSRVIIVVVHVGATDKSSYIISLVCPVVVVLSIHPSRHPSHHPSSSSWKKKKMMEEEEEEKLL